MISSDCVPLCVVEEKDAGALLRTGKYLSLLVGFQQSGVPACPDDVGRKNFRCSGGFARRSHLSQPVGTVQ